MYMQPTLEPLWLQNWIQKVRQEDHISYPYILAKTLHTQTTQTYPREYGVVELSSDGHLVVCLAQQCV